MNCHSDVPSPSGVIKLPVKDELLTIRGFQTQPEKSGKKKVELGEKGITATLLVSHDENVIWIRRIAPKKQGNASLCSATKFYVHCFTSECFTTVAWFSCHSCANIEALELLLKAIQFHSAAACDHTHCFEYFLVSVCYSSVYRLLKFCLSLKT